jgi:hypothetical protein
MGRLWSAKLSNRINGRAFGLRRRALFCQPRRVMPIPAVLLLLLALFSPTLAAEDAPPAPPADASPRAAQTDAEIEAVRRLLESGGLVVGHLSRMESGMISASVRLGLSTHPRVRSEAIHAFVFPSRVRGIWVVRLTMPGRERSGLNGEPAEARETVADAVYRSPFLRDLAADRGEHEEEGPRNHMFHAAHHASAADTRAFAAFLVDVAEVLGEVFSAEAEGLPLVLTESERAREPLEAARKNLADRLRVRAIQGLPVPRPGSPEAEDPLSMASHPLDPSPLSDLLAVDCSPELLPELEASTLAALPGHLALLRHLRLKAGEPQAELVDQLRALAHGPEGSAHANPWALYHWARRLMQTLPDEDQTPVIVDALDVLRQSARLGCEEALSYYLHVLSRCDEPLVNGESHWEQRERWEALWRHFNPHEVQEEVEVERAYRAGDLSPVRIGVKAEGEELRQVRLAVDEMNAARKARGWKLLEVVEERPASEPLVGDVQTKDPAEAGSGREG